MNLKDWEEKRDGVAKIIAPSTIALGWQDWRNEATAALEFLGIPKPEPPTEHYSCSKHSIITRKRIHRSRILRNSKETIDEYTGSISVRTIK